MRSSREARTLRALCVGIDSYPGQELSGCVADARQWRKTLEKLGFVLEGLYATRRISRSEERGYHGSDNAVRRPARDVDLTDERPMPAARTTSRSCGTFA